MESETAGRIPGGGAAGIFGVVDVHLTFFGRKKRSMKPECRKAFKKGVHLRSSHPEQSLGFPKRIR